MYQELQEEGRAAGTRRNEPQYTFELFLRQMCQTILWRGKSCLAHENASYRREKTRMQCVWLHVDHHDYGLRLCVTMYAHGCQTHADRQYPYYGGDVTC